MTTGAEAARLQSIDHFVTDSQEAGEKNAAAYFLSPLSAAIRAVSQLNLHPVFQTKTLDLTWNATPFSLKKNHTHTHFTTMVKPNSILSSDHEPAPSIILAWHRPCSHFQMLLTFFTFIFPCHIPMCSKIQGVKAEILNNMRWQKLFHEAMPQFQPSFPFVYCTVCILGINF